MSRNYLDNEEILKEITDYKKSGKMVEGKFIEGRPSERLGEMIQLIAQNYSSKGSFASYTWREDMVSDAVYVCLKYMHNFREKEGEKPNPFAYLTTIIYRAFLNYIKKQKKHSEIKDICYKRVDMLDDENFISKGINYELLRYEKRKRRKTNK